MGFDTLIQKANSASMNLLGKTTATAKRHGRAVGTLDVIFNNPSQDSSPFPAGVGMPNTAPTALVKDADITRLAIEEEETRLLIGPTLYGITRIDPDGTGMTLITLTEDFLT